MKLYKVTYGQFGYTYVAADSIAEAVEKLQERHRIAHGPEQSLNIIEVKQLTAGDGSLLGGFIV